MANIQIPESPLTTEMEWCHWFGSGKAAIWGYKGIIRWNGVTVTEINLGMDDFIEAELEFANIVAAKLRKVFE